jgi:hypothetical protein
MLLRTEAGEVFDFSSVLRNDICVHVSARVVVFVHEGWHADRTRICRIHAQTSENTLTHNVCPQRTMLEIRHMQLLQIAARCVHIEEGKDLEAGRDVAVCKVAAFKR